jgi:hypothetical protein
MNVFELRYPGTWLKQLSPVEAHAIQSVLSLVEGHLADAAVCLAWFEVARAAMRTREPAKERWERRATESQAVDAEVARRVPPGLAPDEAWAAREALRETVTLEARRQDWTRGVVPETYAFRVPFIHAHSFLFAFVGILKALRAFEGMGAAPATARAAAGRLSGFFPAAVGIRDSAHHAEERIRGLKKGGKKIHLKPIDTKLIRAPGGALVLSALNGNRLGYTMDDGAYGELEVSRETLESARVIIQEVLDALAWKGPARAVPT